MKIFAERLREERKIKNLSQKQLGEVLNVTQQAIAKMESEKSQPSFEDLVKLCIFFNVSSDYLLGLED